MIPGFSTNQHGWPGTPQRGGACPGGLCGLLHHIPAPSEGSSALPEETPSLPLHQTTLNLFSELLTTESLEGFGQKFLSLQADLAAAERPADATARLDSVREQTRLASLGLPYAGAWLNVVPSPALGLHLCRPFPGLLG